MRGSPRRWAGIGLAATALAGIALTAAGCSSHSGVTTAPATARFTPTVAVPQVKHLSSAIVLQPVLGQQSPPPVPASGCPAGYVALTAPSQGSQCYHRTGAPLTITSAAVRVAAAPGGYALFITVPPTEKPALTTVTTKAADEHGFVDISVSGQTWAIPKALAPLDGGQFEVALSSQSQATQLQHILVPTS